MLPVGCLLLAAAAVSAYPATSVASASATAVFPGATEWPDSDFRFYDIPTDASGPCDLTNGPDGDVWIDTLFAEKLVRINPSTGNITEYQIPFTGPLGVLDDLPLAKGLPALACVVRTGKDGNIYAANGLRNQLVKFDSKTQKVSVFTPPGALSAAGNLQPLNDMWAGETGIFYSQTTANMINFFDYKTEKFTSWTVPTPLAGPLGMRLAPDGKLWFTEFLAQKIASLDPKSGIIKEYTIPVPSLLAPAVMRAQLNGRHLFFTGAGSDSIGRIDIYTHDFTAYPNTAPLSTLSVPSEDTTDSAGYVWFCTFTQNLLSRLNETSGDMIHVEVPGTDIVAPVSLPFALGVGVEYYNYKKANQLFFTQATLNRVGRLQLPAP